MTGWDRKALLVPRCGWKSGMCVPLVCLEVWEGCMVCVCRCR